MSKYITVYVIIWLKEKKLFFKLLFVVQNISEHYRLVLVLVSA